jgi:hypothetical protein
VGTSARRGDVVSYTPVHERKQRRFVNNPSRLLIWDASVETRVVEEVPDLFLHGAHLQGRVDRGVAVAATD